MTEVSLTWWPFSVRLRYRAWLMPLCALVKNRMRIGRTLDGAGPMRDVLVLCFGS